MNILRRILGRLQTASLRWLDPNSVHRVEAFSQEGEDLILKRIFNDKTHGFYVDVGAHHPARLSNTYLFYRAGWRGINIDAMPGSLEPFFRQRPRDINLELAIAARSGEERTYFEFEEPAYNTFDERLATSRTLPPISSRILNRRTVRTWTLAEILQEHLPENQQIDFLTVDVEGLDLEVIQSNAWERFRPTYVLVECYEVAMRHLQGEEIIMFLIAQGYEFFAKTVNTVIFKTIEK